MMTIAQILQLYRFTLLSQSRLAYLRSTGTESERERGRERERGGGERRMKETRLASLTAY